MVDTRARTHLVRTIALVTLAMCFPACQSAGWAPSPAVRSPEDGSTRLSLRPILDGAGYRPYFVGGYAGATYGPGLFGRGATAAVAAPAAGPSSVTVDSGNWTPE